MIVIYHTESNRSIFVKTNKDITELYPNETRSIDDIDDCGEIEILSCSETKRSTKRIILLFLVKLVINIFNVFIMNIPINWLEEIDPFVFCYKHSIKSNQICLNYNSGKISLQPNKRITIKQPKLYINEKTIDIKYKVEPNRIKNLFVNRIIDIVVLWIYCSLIITTIFILSYKFWDLLVVYVVLMFILLCVTSAIIAKTHREKCMLLKEMCN